MTLMIPTEPIGSIPGPVSLIQAIGDGDGADPARVLGTRLASEKLGSP